MLNGRLRLVTTALCGIAALLATGGMAAPATAALNFEFVKGFGPDGTSVSSFSKASSVAVDESDEAVYVLDREANTLYKFDLEGTPIPFGGVSPNLFGNELTGLSISGTRGEQQVAVDPKMHTVYLTGERDPVTGFATALQAFQSNGDPALFAAGPGKDTNEITNFSGIEGIAVDGTGTIYASDFGGNSASSKINIFSRSGAPITSFSPGTGAANVAVGSDGALYVTRTNSTVRRFLPSQYPVTSVTTYVGDLEVLDSNGPYSVAVDPVEDDVYVIEDNPMAQVVVFDREGFPKATFGGPGEGELDQAGGIAVDGRGERVFVAQSPEGAPSQVVIFQRERCVCPPDIEATAASAVTADSASLRGLINPNRLGTTYWFEFGVIDCSEGPCTKVPADGAPIGDGHNGVKVTQPITGLKADTLYFYRAVAENEEGVTEGETKTFTTQGSGLGFMLSDSRAWEMVSPSEKFGGTIINSSISAIQASVGGDKLVYSSLGAIVEDPAGSRTPEPASVLGQRNADGEWTSDDLTPPHSVATLLRGDTEFKIFTPDLLSAEMEPTDGTPLSTLASEQTPYRWTAGVPPLFAPLVSPSNVPPGTHFGPNASGEGVNNPVRIEGASSDLEHLVIRSENAPLVEGAELDSIYLSEEDELEAVSELPEFEGGKVVQAILGSGRGSVGHAVSNDGTRVFWAPTSPTQNYGPGTITLPRLYLRNTVAGETSRLDNVQPGGSAAGLEAPAFNGASADGSVVFFTDSQQLTEDASPSGRDLYRCEIGIVEGGLGCADLTDISAPLEGSGESAEVLDQVSGLSEDGSRLYFVARGVLDEQPNDEAEAATAGEPNLYYWQDGKGVRYIGSLSERDEAVWGARGKQVVGFAAAMSAKVSPGGHFFAFTSERSLTGYENRNGSNRLNTEVFVYDADADDLSCVSCNPSGAAAIGELLPPRVNRFPADPAGLWANRWVAATLPEASQTQEEGRSLYRSRSVLDNGRVFFNAVDPLVPADSNGNWDVYQYEPVGVGTCTEESSASTVSRSGSGCVGLISSGTSEGASGFFDATPVGDDVFFLTPGRLSVRDTDGEMDVYDARVNGIPAVLKPVQECAGEACQPAVGPPNDPTPASESFRGAETRIKCRKGQRRVRRNGRTVCVRKKQKKHNKQHQRRASNKSGRANQ
jgi:hypothetical protein